MDPPPDSPPLPPDVYRGKPPPALPATPPVLDSATGSAPAAAPPRPWGFWATAGFGLAIVAAWALAQIVITVGYLLARGISPKDFDKFGLDGTLLALATLLAAPVFVGLSVLAAALRQGMRWRDYLAVRRAPARDYAIWLGAACLLMLAGDTLAHASGRPIVPEFMAKVWHGGNPALLVLALALAAPLGEEVFFRGFLYAGFARTRLGGPGAVLVTAALFGLVHTQYDFFGVGAVFASGLLMGAARWRTGSLWVPVSMHVLQNLIGCLQAALLTAPPAA